MKFAIYGDSYADAHHSAGNYNHLTWASKLAGLLGATTVDHHAQGATPFIYSYRKIMNTAHSYDRIIVAVTDPGRYTQPVEGHYITGVNSIDSRVKRSAIRSQLMGWFYSRDDLFMSTVQELMLQQITALCPTAILVPCFPDSFTPQRRSQSLWRDVSLCHFGHEAVVQAQLVNVTYQEVIGVNSLLCHMPADWQKPVAQAIYGAVTNHRSVTIPRLGLRFPISNYFKTS